MKIFSNGFRDVFFGQFDWVKNQGLNLKEEVHLITFLQLENNVLDEVQLCE